MQSDTDVFKIKGSIEDFFLLALETVEIAKKNGINMVSVCHTTSEERIRRATLLKSLLKELGIKAIKLSTWENGVFLYYGDLLLQFHKVFEVAMKDVGGDKALQGLLACMMMFIEQRAVKLGYKELISPTIISLAYGEKEVKTITKFLSKALASRDSKIVGEILALQHLVTLTSDALKLEHFPFERYRSSSLGLVDAMGKGVTKFLSI